MLISVECLICEEYMANFNEDAYLPILHLSRVELRCKLQEKLHRVTAPLDRQEYNAHETTKNLISA